MDSELEFFASHAASGSAPVDPASVFAETLSDISGKCPVIYDEDIKSSYLEKLSGEIGVKMPEMAGLPLDDFYNYAVFASRPVKMTGGPTGMAHAGVPGQFKDMAINAEIAPQNRPAIIRAMANVAKSGEAVSEGGMAIERIAPIGPTPKNGSLKKMFMTAALMASMAISALSGPGIPPQSTEQASPGKILAEPLPDKISVLTWNGKEYKSIIENKDDHQRDMLQGMLDARKYEPIYGMAEGKREVLKKAVDDPFFSDANPEWMALKKSCKGKPEKKQLEIVNAFWNRKINYLDDEVTYGKSEYWATPSETAKALAGDCEDYAIAKFATLWNLGLGNDVNMKIVCATVQDLAEGHALLAFQGDGGLFFLNNGKTGELLTQEKINGRFYPDYALNTRKCWMASGVKEDSPTMTFNSVELAKKGAREGEAMLSGRARIMPRMTM